MKENSGSILKYEIINPSDECYLEHSDRRVAIAACLVLGRGKYGLKDPSGNIVCPIVAFGGAELFLIEIYGGKEGFADFLDSNSEELAIALETVALQRERTSLNNIQEAAMELATNYRNASK